jgi:predicted RNase H-like nuclease (RuvC/YqgF family)
MFSRRANERLEAEVPGLKRRVEMLEHENRRLSEAKEIVKRDVGAAVAEGSAKVKRDLTNLEQELAKWKEETRTIDRSQGRLRRRRMWLFRPPRGQLPRLEVFGQFHDPQTPT